MVEKGNYCCVNSTKNHVCALSFTYYSLARTQIGVHNGVAVVLVQRQSGPPTVLHHRRVRLDQNGRPAHLSAMIGAAVHAMDCAQKVPTNIMIAQPSLASLIDVDETYTPRLAEYGVRANLAGKNSVEDLLADMAKTRMFATFLFYRDKDGEFRL